MYHKEKKKAYYIKNAEKLKEKAALRRKLIKSGAVRTKEKSTQRPLKKLPLFGTDF